MRKKPKSVQFTLFISFSAILFITFSTFTTYYISSESKKIEQQAYDTIGQNVLTISSNIDKEVNSLDTVAQNIAYSNLVKNHFYTYLSMDSETVKEDYDSMQNAKVLTDLLVSIIGPNRPVDQIYLYSIDQGCFGSGLDNNSSTLSVSKMEWYDYLQSSDVKKTVFCDRDERLEKYFSYSEGDYFLTYCLVFNNALFNKPQGVVEVKKSATGFMEDITRLTSTGYDEKVSIYDINGNIVYPLGTEDYNRESFLNINKETDSVLDYDVYLSLGEKDKHVFYYTSDYSDFTTVISVDDASLKKPIFEFVNNNILLFLLFLAVGFGLSFIISKIITDPILKMYSQIQSYDMNSQGNENEFEVVNTNIIELDTLFSALIDMQKRNKKSMEREILLHNQEMQSRMLALQSQMNPHFLYNSLATIQSMADEEMNEEIINMCQTISRILRYISSDKQLMVSIEEDLLHVKDYLECMKIRYEDDLDYSIEIPEEMYHLLIPKLCLQLIVENSIKYATKSVRPPWKIDIQGIISSTYWEISITDNGLGFNEEDIEKINEKIDYINETSLLPSLELNGMGLLNIYMRFKTLYKGNHIFRLSNLATGGAKVTIGGDLYREGEKYE